MKTYSATLLFEHPLGRITHEPGQFIRLQWLAGLREVAAVQTVFGELQRAKQRTACEHLLIDERLASSFEEDAKRWLVEQGLADLCQSMGYSRVAIIAATDVYARLSSVPVQAELHRYRLSLSQRTFVNEAEALAWLARG